MDISRKDFFKKSLVSLGEAVSTVANALKSDDKPTATLRDTSNFKAVERADMLAVSDNKYCMAKNCGCFACSESCKSRAIMIVMGEGIRVDSASCVGCGSCEYVCPATPKAVKLQPRNA